MYRRRDGYRAAYSREHCVSHMDSSLLNTVSCHIDYLTIRILCYWYERARNNTCSFATAGSRSGLKRKSIPRTGVLADQWSTSTSQMFIWSPWVWKGIYDTCKVANTPFQIQMDDLMLAQRRTRWANRYCIVSKSRACLAFTGGRCEIYCVRDTYIRQIKYEVSSELYWIRYNKP